MNRIRAACTGRVSGLACRLRSRLPFGASRQRFDVLANGAGEAGDGEAGALCFCFGRMVFAAVCELACADPMRRTGDAGSAECGRFGASLPLDRGARIWAVAALAAAVRHPGSGVERRLRLVCLARRTAFTTWLAAQLGTTRPDRQRCGQGAARIVRLRHAVRVSDYPL